MTFSFEFCFICTQFLFASTNPNFDRIPAEVGMTMFRSLLSVALILVTTVSLAAQGAAGARGQRRGAGPDNTPRPIAAFDSVWIEEMTWMEVRDALKGGKTTAIIPAGS